MDSLWPRGRRARRRFAGLDRPLAGAGGARYAPGLVHQSLKLWTLLAGGTALLLLGLADDRRSLDWRLRLAVQTLVAAVMVALGWRANLLGGIPAAAEVLSVLWIVGLVNAFNMLDNMDGLSAGVAAIAAAVLAVVMFSLPGPTITNRNSSSAACCW